MLTQPFTLKLASIEEASGRPKFRGIGAPYSTPSGNGDQLRAGLFAKSISDRGGTFPLLWQHRQEEPVGSVTVESSDAKALNVSGLLLADVIARAKEVHQLMLVGAITGISVGFISLRSQPLKDGTTEHIEGRLCELSLVSVPAFAEAKVTSVEAAIDALTGLTPQELAAVRCSLNQKLGTDDGRVRDAFRAFDPGKWK